METSLQGQLVVVYVFRLQYNSLLSTHLSSQQETVGQVKLNTVQDAATCTVDGPEKEVKILSEHEGQNGHVFWCKNLQECPGSVDLWFLQLSAMRCE